MHLIPPNTLELLNKIDAFAAQAPEEVKAFFDSRMWQARVLRELGRDLRDLSLRRDRVSSHEAIFESIRPLGHVGHIMPGNSEWTPLLAILESAIVGNTSWVKLPSDSDTTLLREQLRQLGLEQSVEVLTSREDAQERYALSDAISAWGSESSLEEIRKQLSPQTRFIPWGHRLSFAYMSQWQDQAQKLAHAIVKYEQLACSSPQLVYLENASFEQACLFAEQVAKELEKLADSFPKLDEATWAELSNFTQTHRAEACLRQKKVFCGKDGEYRIVVDSDPSFEASVLNRTIFIKIIAKEQLSAQLSPHRRFLQTAGLSCCLEDLADYSEMLFAAGVSRVCSIEAMQDAHPLEPHDGEFSLSRFVKRVALHAPASNLNVLTAAKLQEKPIGAITTKSDFATTAKNGDYFFKSGGSSDKAILSPFELEDYHLQMQVAADGLIAAGLNPALDRCMNVFYGGGLYGGFLSFTDILEKCRVPQFPMAGYLEHDFVLETIIEQKINVLLGMPSYLITLFKLAQEKKLKLPVEKIFFGGEPFSSHQRQWLQTCGVKIIKSASYGSVDAGPLGYQCAYSDGGIHHINSSIQNIEIVALNEDRACESNEVGRVLVTSKARRSVVINRYQIGDTARWISGHCPCGDPNPRLELVGRVGDIFKLGGSFINARKLLALSQGGQFQIQLSIKDLKDHMCIVCEDDKTQLKEKLLQITDVHEVCVLEKSVTIEVTNSGFIMASSGKIPLVVDQRR